MKMTAVFMAVPEGYIFSQQKNRDELIIAASRVLVRADTCKRYFTGSLFAPA